MNNLIVSIEFRFYSDSENNYWTDSVFDNIFWDRYLFEFDQVNIVARVKKIDKVEEGWKKVGNDKIKLIPLPYYIGPIQMIKVLPLLNKKLNEISKIDATFILRVPSFIGMILYRKLKNNFSLEVVGDPEEVFSFQNTKSFINLIYKNLFVRELKKQCLKAKGVAYVTKFTLQKKYKPNKNAYTTNYSSIELPDYFYVRKEHVEINTNKGITLLFVGSLSQKYKGLHVLLNAINNDSLSKYNLRLNIIGSGKYMDEYKRMVEDLGLNEKVSFKGQISSKNEMYNYYNSADIFVLPSLTEGLPRVVIEAMATSTPSIGTRVGGLPELLEDESLVEPDDSLELAQKINEFINNNQLINSQVKKNFIESMEYETNILQNKRNKFFRKIK